MLPWSCFDQGDKFGLKLAWKKVTFCGVIKIKDGTVFIICCNVRDFSSRFIDVWTFSLSIHMAEVYCIWTVNKNIPMLKISWHDSMWLMQVRIIEFLDVSTKACYMHHNFRLTYFLTTDHFIWPLYCWSLLFTIQVDSELGSMYVSSMWCSLYWVFYSPGWTLSHWL